MKYCVIDFETRSPVDIKKCGGYVYAMHPDTEVLMMGVITDEQQEGLYWVAPKFRHLVATEIEDSVLHDLVVESPALVAQNAPFERMVWRHKMQLLGFPDFPIEKYHCTQARGLMCGYPKNLDNTVNRWTNGRVLKDKEGHKLMLKLSKPRKFLKRELNLMGEKLGMAPEAVKEAQLEIYELLKVGTLPEVIKKKYPRYRDFVVYHESPELYQRFAEYAKQDVVAEKALLTMPKLPEGERKLWIFDQKINDRGVGIDISACEDAIAVVAEYDEGLTKEAMDIANHQITGMKSSASILAWLATRGLNLTSMDKDTVNDVLKGEHGEQPDDIRRFFEIRQSLNKSSIAKYQTMLNCSAIDGRARGLFVYHGAGTGRWSGALIQTQNLPRTSVGNMVGSPKGFEYEITEGDIELMASRDINLINDFWKDPKLLASDALRAMVVPAKGNEFICADFSAIEGRGLAWFADEYEILEGYKKGLDMYKVAASGVYCIPYEEVDGGGKGIQRQVGKTCELALGYGGGVGAMLAFGAAKMAPPRKELLNMLRPVHKDVWEKLTPEDKNKIIDGDLDNISDIGRKILPKTICRDLTTDALIELWLKGIIKAWREAREKTTKFWYGLVKAAIAAMKSGRRETYDKISFQRVGKFLTMRLPSGRDLYYPEAKLEEVSMPWTDKNTGLPAKKTLVTAMTVEPVRKTFVRRPLNHLILSENATQAICRDLLVEAMFRVEEAGYPVVMHVHDEILCEVPKGYGSLKDFEEIMSITPDWAKGFPIKAVGWRGFRYKK